MKRIAFILFLLLLINGWAFALSTSIGITSNYQLSSGCVYYSEGNSLYAKQMTVNSVDIRLDGSAYITKGFGLGYGVGFQKDLFVEYSSKIYDLSKLPPSLEIFLQSKYKFPINQQINIEIGIGMIVNFYNGSGQVGTKTIVLDYREFSLLTEISLQTKISKSVSLNIGLESTLFTYHFGDPNSGEIVTYSPGNRVSISPSLGLMYIF